MKGWASEALQWYQNVSENESSKKRRRTNGPTILNREKAPANS
jgi:hypothetical protein